MARKLNKWANIYDGVHVTSGPVFDYNYDGLADDDQTIEKYSTVGLRRCL